MARPLGDPLHDAEEAPIGVGQTATRSASEDRPTTGDRVVTRSATEESQIGIDPVIIRSVPVAIRIAGAWSWRVVGVVALLAVFVYLVILLHTVVVPVLVASLLSGLLTPIKHRLMKLGLPKALAVVITFLGMLVAIVGLILLVVVTIRSGLGDFETHINKSIKNVQGLLDTGFLGFSSTDLQNGIDSGIKTVQKNSGTLAAGALSGASTLGDILIGLLLSLFTTLFFLIDGDGIWRWCVRLAPKRARAAVDGAGQAAWLSIGEYARVQILVALLDAVGIGLGAFFLGLPFVVPIAVLVFLAAFIPFVGAVASGGLAVVIALVYLNPVAALIMLAVVILVNQLESHVLQPILMGGAVRLHPVAVVLTVATGSLLGGIAGAVFAVPLVAALNSSISYLGGGAWKGQAPPPTTDLPQKPEGTDDERDAERRRQDEPGPEDVKTVA